jgi:hypothetical protein
MKTQKDIEAALAAIGYRIDYRSSFFYTNDLNPGKPFKARCLPIVETDTGICFAQPTARRDENFRKLQLLRPRSVEIDGTVWEL